MKKNLSGLVPSFRRFACAAMLAALPVLFFAACSTQPQDIRDQTVRRITMPSFMHPREIQTYPFLLTAYERVHKRGGDATIYLEGEGQAFADFHRVPSENPTPTTPGGLYLASRDNGPNVLYLARPCQYTDLEHAGPCDVGYWTTGRFSPDIVSSMNEAIDNMKKKYGFRNINLVGFSDGGSIAVLIAARRDDVASIRTVAANLDINLWAQQGQKAPLTESLNPADVALDIANIPQQHFTASWDEGVTKDLYESYFIASGRSPCVHGSVVDGVTHDKGWTKHWPYLLKAPLTCDTPAL